VVARPAVSDSVQHVVANGHLLDSILFIDVLVHS